MATKKEKKLLAVVEQKNIDALKKAFKIGDGTWNPKISLSLKRNPKIPHTQAERCDAGLHQFIVFKPKNKEQIMCCGWCGARKGGLKPIKLNIFAKVKGSSTSKATLTAKKTK